MQPRIAPIDKPKSLIARIGFWIMKRDFGKVIMPAKVIYSRYPGIMMAVKKLYDVQDSFKQVTESDKLLIQNYIAILNHCSFCIDISMKRAIQKNMSLDKFYDLENYRSGSHFSAGERAMLSFVDEVTKNVEVSDKTYNELKEHFSDEQIIEITYIAAFENYLNRLTKPLGIGSDELCGIR